MRKQHLLQMALAVILTLTHTVHAEPTAVYPFTSSADANRFTALTKEIRCVVCQNQNIADSNAPLANDLRQKVYLMVKNNQSDTDIKNYLVKRYGDFILLEPRITKTTYLLWIFPFITACAVFLVLFFSRQNKSRPS